MERKEHGLTPGVGSRFYRMVKFAPLDLLVFGQSREEFTNLIELLNANPVTDLRGVVMESAVDEREFQSKSHYAVYVAETLEILLQKRGSEFEAYATEEMQETLSLFGYWLLEESGSAVEECEDDLLESTRRQIQAGKKACEDALELD